MRFPRTTIVASLTTAPPVPSMSVAPTMAISVSGATLARPVRCVCAPIEALEISITTKPDVRVRIASLGLGVTVRTNTTTRERQGNGRRASPADRYRIYLEAGDRIDIQVLDYSYSGPSIRMIMPDGRRLEAAAGNNYLTTMVTTAPVSGYYLVMVGLVYETGLQYELRIR